MMNINVRILVATVCCLLLGSGLPLLAAESIPVIQGLGAEAGTSGPVLHLRTTDSLEALPYSPQPGVWEVVMPEASWDEAIRLFSEPELGIERAELSHDNEFGKEVSRLTVWLDQPARLNVAQTGNGLALEFATFTAEPPAAMAPTATEPPAGDVIVEVPPVRTTTEVAATRSAEQWPAHLSDVVQTASGATVTVELRADRGLQGNAFLLPDPERLVIDFEGVIFAANHLRLPVGSGLVRQVRVAQNRSDPTPVTRVVMDLEGVASYQVQKTGSGATIVVGPEGDDLKVAEVVVPAVSTAIISDEKGTIQITRSEPVQRSQPEPARDVSSSLFDLPDEPTPAAEEVAAIPEANQPEPDPWVADRAQMIEQVPVASTIDGPTVEGQKFAETEVESEEVPFTGEPITLTLKDADIKDVLKTFSVLTDLNIVLDPAVSGSVTVELRDVPWDQALDLILKINGLDYVLENNVLRVAPIQKLASEKAAKAAFEIEREKAKPLKTVLKPLSYAKADYVAGLLSSDSYLLSGRGSVTVDERTNTLIIRDVVDRVEGILRLIDSLDLPTPQVVIEGRIVETTRDFSRELGVSWGFTGVMDAEHGNDTGLRFPNSMEISGDVDLARGGNGILAMTFGDILNTFNLDFLLAASESDGLVRIVSTPRVTTQNLQKASIRSGLQIPVQTVANNTVTVQYVDATLRLEVTPQITAEGTVNLDINIKKQEPVIAAAVAGGQNAPIFTRDAETQLLVRDGGTTVIAGIYQINDQNNENRVPGLHKIPILGHLFKNKGVFKRHDELLIFITPRIVKY